MSVSQQTEAPQVPRMREEGTAPALRARSLVAAGRLMNGVSQALRRLPQGGRYRLADALTAPLLPALAGRRRVIATNYATMLHIGPSVPRVQWLTRSSIQNYARMAMDFLAVRTMSDAEVLGWVEAVGTEHLDAALRASRGVIFALPHVGSWDVAAVFAQAYGYQLTVVTESNWVTELVAGSRAGHGVTLAPRDHSLRLLFRALARNECVVMLSDIAQDGLQLLAVPFFGTPAPFPMGPGRLAQHTGAPLLVISSVRLANGRYRVEAQPPLWPDRSAPAEEEARRLTQAMVAGFERIIAAYPEQWYPFHPIWPQSGG